MDEQPPQIIWRLWLQGWDQAPDIVRACAASWTRLNPGWDVRDLDAASLREMFAPTASDPGFFLAAISPAALSDLVRLKLLDKHGGVWVDATTYCLAPLDAWLPGVMSQGFFAFDRPRPDRMIASWFLAASAGHPAVRLWLAAAEDYWRNRSSPDIYHWVHGLFEDVYEARADFRAIWDLTPKWSANGPHALAPYPERLLGPLTAEVRTFVEDAGSPLLKLTHRIDHDLGKAGSVYRWLCDRERVLATGAGEYLEKSRR